MRRPFCISVVVWWVVGKIIFADVCFRSISRATNVTAEQVQNAIQSTAIVLDHPKEWKLAKLVLKLPEIVLRCVDDLLLHTLCDYLYELATTFTEYYDNCYVVEKDRQSGKVYHIQICKIDFWVSGHITPSHYSSPHPRILPPSPNCNDRRCIMK